MFKPIPEHDKILSTNKCGFAFRTASAGIVSRVVCGIIDQNTGLGFIEADGETEEAAFNKAVKQIGKVARPFASEDAKALAEKDARIAALEAQLAEATAPKSSKGGKKTDPVPEPVTA